MVCRQDGCPACWWAICSSGAARLPAARLDLLLLLQSTRIGKCIRIPRFCPDRICKTTKRTCWENKACSHCEVQKYCCLHLSRDRNKTWQNSDWLTVTQQAWGWDTAPNLVCPALVNGLGHWMWGKVYPEALQGKDISMVTGLIHKMRKNSALEWLRMFTSTQQLFSHLRAWLYRGIPTGKHLWQYLWIEYTLESPHFCTGCTFS